MATVIPPNERVCERCGRHDVWDAEADAWLIVTDDGDKAVGNPHCLHEWDINGNYNPFEE
ncbi:MAG: HEWD family protein [Halorientalis sp.]